MEQAITTLQGKAKVRRTMWSRRAQEYETKIKSGDPVSIAEVVRDLHRLGKPVRTVIFRAADVSGGTGATGP